jgi:sigma-B regulation protein RsbU (phosphoserine phosphatase)
MVSFTNNYISDTHGNANMFATLFVGIISLQDGTLTYANCGNEPPFLIGDCRELSSLKPTGPVVGLFPWAQFAVKETVMEKGDLILIFTDGVPDAHNEANLGFGRDKVLELLSAGRSAAAILQDLIQKLNDFTGSAAQFDDITLLAIRRSP